MGIVHISSKGCHNLWRCVVPSNWPTGKLSSCSLHPGCCCSAPLRHLPRDCQAVWLCKLYIGSVRKTMVNPRSRKEVKTTHWTTAKTKNSVVLQLYKWKRSRFKSLNLGSGRNTKKITTETRFFFSLLAWEIWKFQVASVRNFSHLEFLALSSWTQVAGTPEHPKNQQIFRVIRVPSEFLPKVDQLGPSQGNSTNLTAPRIASCNSSLDKAPLPSLSYCFK